MDGNNAAVQNVQRKEKPQHLFPIGRRRTTTSIERQREHRYSKTSTKFIQNIQVPYSYLWWTPEQWKLQSCAEILSQNWYRWVQRLAKFLRWCKKLQKSKMFWYWWKQSKMQYIVSLESPSFIQIDFNFKRGRQRVCEWRMTRPKINIWHEIFTER